MSEHVQGQNVGTYAYKAHGCRCEDCTAAATAYMRKMRSRRDRALVRVARRQELLAVKWMRKHHPDVMRDLLAKAYDELGIERRSPGPRTEATP